MSVALCVPQKPRHQRCFGAAWNLIKTLDVTTLPVDPFALLDKLNIEYHASSFDGLDGAFLQWPGSARKVVIYNENIRSAERIRWTVMHELAHFWLGHLDIPGFEYLSERDKEVLDREADYMTKEVLAPLGVLSLLGISEAEDISYICGLSREAARIRESELRKLQKMNSKVLRHSERNALEQFRRFLAPISICRKPFERSFAMRLRPNGVASASGFKGVSCGRCGTSTSSPQARYCTNCGAPILGFCGCDPLKIERPCGHVNPPGSRYCEICGHETVLVSKGILLRWEEEQRQQDFPDVPF